MRNFFSVMLALILLISSYPAAQAAELLDVKPIVSGSSVSLEVTADIPMTYTFYKVPGQARAVVDIADADPEKVEALIVVNKGAVSSISVDKVQIAGMVVSRLVFNLVAESDIFVKPNPDRKLLTVTFGGSTASAASPPPAPVEVAPEPVIQKKPEVVATVQKPAEAEPVKKVEPAAPVAAAAAATSKEEEDPLGLDDPPASAQKKEAPVVTSPNSDGAPAAVVKTPKLEPVVPIGPRSGASSIQKIVTGSAHIDIQTNGAVAGFKVFSLSKPERLAIDIPGVNKSLAGKSVAINKFGILKVRVGVYPEYTRIVFDTSKSEFPKHTVTSIQDGLRISFK